MYSALSPPSIPQLGALEQGTESPTAPRAPQHKWLPTAPGCVWCVCSLLCVCTLDGLIAEHELRVWVTILGRMSLHTYILILLQSRVMSDWQFFMSLLWGPAWFLCHSQGGCEVIYVLSQKAGHPFQHYYDRGYSTLHPVRKELPCGVLCLKNINRTSLLSVSGELLLKFAAKFIRL